jgi:hypothetical protein
MIVGLCVLHYGQSYLAEAIQAVYPVCNKIVIVYSEKPSFGYNMNLDCPEKREDLMIKAFLNDTEGKVEWHEGVFKNQAEHRRYAYDVCQQLGATIIPVFDSDEIWNTTILQEAVTHSASVELSMKIKMCHFFRSFSYVCNDYQRQTRIINVKAENKQIKPKTWDVKLSIWHFGYSELKNVEYKMKIHGDMSEFRKDIDWYKDRFLKFPIIKNDLHPVIPKMWNAIPFDKNTLPDFLKRHPHFNLDIIP